MVQVSDRTDRAGKAKIAIFVHHNYVSAPLPSRRRHCVFFSRGQQRNAPFHQNDGKILSLRTSLMHQK